MASGMEKNCGEKKVLQGRKVTKKGREEKYCNGGAEKLQINVEREKLLQGRKVTKKVLQEKNLQRKSCRGGGRKLQRKGEFSISFKLSLGGMSSIF